MGCIYCNDNTYDIYIYIWTCLVYFRPHIYPWVCHVVSEGELQWYSQDTPRKMSANFTSSCFQPNLLGGSSHLSMKNWMGPYQLSYSGLGVRSVGPVGDFLEFSKFLVLPSNHCAPWFPKSSGTPPRRPVSCATATRDATSARVSWRLLGQENDATR